MLTKEMKEFLANEAVGTCLSAWDFVIKLATVFDDFDETDEYEITQAINDYGIYLCETCSWWNEEGDIYSPEICTDCYEEENQ